MEKPQEEIAPGVFIDKDGIKKALKDVSEITPPIIEHIKLIINAVTLVGIVIVVYKTW